MIGEMDMTKLHCVWEHNGNDTLLYAADADFYGVYARGKSRDEAAGKIAADAAAYCRWLDAVVPDGFAVEIVQEQESTLQICDADSDVLFDAERPPLTAAEYETLRDRALRSARDFLALYRAVPDAERSALPVRETFYGAAPRTAREMYEHTKNVNAYYFGEIGVDVGNDGDILPCRCEGFRRLERQEGYLENPVFSGSWGEDWTLRKLLRRFLWHDRIHAKAMWRMARRTFGHGAVPDVFRFED